MVRTRIWHGLHLTCLHEIFTVICVFHYQWIECNLSATQAFSLLNAGSRVLSSVTHRRPFKVISCYRHPKSETQASMLRAGPKDSPLFHVPTVVEIGYCHPFW